MKIFCEYILKKIDERSPSESTLFISVEQAMDSMYTAKIIVRSKQGNFLGRALDAFDCVAVSKASTRILDSLSQWQIGKYKSKLESKI